MSPSLRHAVKLDCWILQSVGLLRVCCPLLAFRWRRGVSVVALPRSLLSAPSVCRWLGLCSVRLETQRTLTLGADQVMEQKEQVAGCIDVPVPVYAAFGANPHTVDRHGQVACGRALAVSLV